MILILSNLVLFVKDIPTPWHPWKLKAANSRKHTADDRYESEVRIRAIASI